MRIRFFPGSGPGGPKKTGSDQIQIRNTDLQHYLIQVTNISDLINEIVTKRQNPLICYNRDRCTMLPSMLHVMLNDNNDSTFYIEGREEGNHLSSEVLP